MARAPKYTLDEILSKADNALEIADKIRTIIDTAKEARKSASPGGADITDEEVLAIKAAAQELVDAAQRLADEVVEDALD